jgi:hypothetical protein
MSYTQTHTQSSSLIIFFSNLLSSLEKRESSRNSKDSSPFRLSSVLTNHHSFNAAERFEDRRRSTNTRQSTGPKIVDTKTTPINSSSDKTYVYTHTHRHTRLHYVPLEAPPETLAIRVKGRSRHQYEFLQRIENEKERSGK